MTLKQESSGVWFVSFGFELDDTQLPDTNPVTDLEGEDIVGLDLGVNNYIHTSDGLSVDWLELTDEYNQLESAQRDLSRKQYGSNNWEKNRVQVAERKLQIQRKVVDFQHKLTKWLTTEYECVVVEDLAVQKMLGGSLNA